MMQTFHLVRNEQAPDWIMAGWLALPTLEGTHHGVWSVCMTWLCDCKIPYPNRA